MHHYTLPTSWLYSFLTNCSFGFGKICVDKHIQLRQVQKIQDQSNFIWFCIGCLLPCSDGEKEKLKLLTIAYFVEKVSWIWIRYLKLPAKCFRSCIRHFTNLSSRETLASKEWIWVEQGKPWLIMYFESDYGKIRCLCEDWNILSSNISSRELLSVLHLLFLLVRTLSLIMPQSHKLYM